MAREVLIRPANERWSDTDRTVSTLNAAGQVVSVRNYTAQEVAQLESARAETIQDQARWEQSVKEAEAQRALVQASIALAPAPTAGGAWVQPTGAQNAYAKDSKVTHNGKNWISLTPFNVWAPGVSGWREQVAEGYPAWIQPTGAQDAYPMNAKVSHNGQNWENTGSAANAWEPGVFGWTVIP